MKRRELLLAAAACACGSPARRGAFAASALSVARQAGQTPALDAAAERFFWRELNRLADSAREMLARGAPLADAVRGSIFTEHGFSREVDATDLRFVLLPTVVRVRRGSCVGLGSLCLALTEALGVAASGVLRPGHFYVRLEQGGAHINLELLRGGEAMPDSWYETRFPAPRRSPSEYGRPLTMAETLGVIEFNVGNERRREQRIDAARAAYARATLQFPGFAEAHASLGAALHLVGHLDEAWRSYQTARRLDPALPNLEHNLSLLATERSERGR